MLIGYEETDERRMLRETVRAFAENEIKPLLPQAEAEQRFPLQLLKQMGDLGLLGDETGAARGELMRIFDGERILVAARCIGLAQAAYELALKRVGEREQFGRPIGEFQGTGFKIAEMLTEIKAARLLTYAAASCYDQQVEHKLDTAAAKLFAIQVAERCASACLQIHGSWGLIEGVYDEVVRNFMDSRVSLVTTGSVEVQKQSICRLLEVM